MHAIETTVSLPLDEAEAALRAALAEQDLAAASVHGHRKASKQPV